MLHRPSRPGVPQGEDRHPDARPPPRARHWHRRTGTRGTAGDMLLRDHAPEAAITGGCESAASSHGGAATARRRVRRRRARRRQCAHGGRAGRRAEDELVDDDGLEKGLFVEALSEDEDGKRAPSTSPGCGRAANPARPAVPLGSPSPPPPAAEASPGDPTSHPCTRTDDNRGIT